MVELTKQQKNAIKAVGKACAEKSDKPSKQFVYSDDAKIYGTNGQILFMMRGVGAPKGAYFPKDAETADTELSDVGANIDCILKQLHDCEKFNLYPAENPYFYNRAKNAFDTEYKKEIYQIIFSAEGLHFQTANFFLKRLIKKAMAFVENGFSLYQNVRNEPCIFESDDKKRVAIVMPILKDYKIIVLNDVDLNGGAK